MNWDLLRNGVIAIVALLTGSGTQSFPNIVEPRQTPVQLASHSAAIESGVPSAPVQVFVD